MLINETAVQPYWLRDVGRTSCGCANKDLSKRTDAARQSGQRRVAVVRAAAYEHLQVSVARQNKIPHDMKTNDMKSNDMK
jgi:hypothetical protein